jgi:predicted CoA-binding protein
MTRMTDFTPLLAEPDTSIAVVGATDSPGKYGGIIYRDLKGRGFRVFAVNPSRDTVDGDPAYAGLADLPEAPTIIDVVVPPAAGRRMLDEAERLGYRRIWFQPGAETPGLVEEALARGFEVLADACIMVRARTAGMA